MVRRRGGHLCIGHHNCMQWLGKRVYIMVRRRGVTYLPHKGSAIVVKPRGQTRGVVSGLIVDGRRA